MTARDLIKGSLRLIGAIATGEDPSSAEESDALLVLNDMIESWALSHLLIYQNTREVFTLVSSQSSYTIGVGGNFNTSRPIEITSVGILFNNIESPLDVLTTQNWAAIENKTLTAILPTGIYASNSYPLDVYNIYPVPSTAVSLILYTKKVISGFTNATDTVALPPGYSRALRYNLAVELALEYGKDLSQIILIKADESKVDIQRQNTEASFLSSGINAIIGGGSVSFNITTGI